MFCQHCGNEIGSGATFCGKCGKATSPGGSGTPPVDAGASIKNEYWAAAIGAGGLGYYLPRFLEYEKNGTSRSWNWAAFFFTSFWLLYRKMWLWAFLYVPVSVYVSFGIDFSKTGDSYSPLPIALFVLAFILPAQYATSFYYRHTKHNILKILAQFPDEQIRLRLIDQAGGTSIVAIVIWCVVLLIIGGIIGAMA